MYIAIIICYNGQRRFLCVFRASAEKQNVMFAFSVDYAFLHERDI